MEIASQKAKEMIEEMMSSMDPLGKYPMCWETAKSCALKSVRNTIKDYIRNMENFPDLVAVFRGGLTWWQHVEQKIKEL